MIIQKKMRFLISQLELIPPTKMVLLNIIITIRLHMYVVFFFLEIYQSNNIGPMPSEYQLCICNIPPRSGLSFRSNGYRLQQKPLEFQNLWMLHTGTTFNMYIYKIQELLQRHLSQSGSRFTGFVCSQNLQLSAQSNIIISAKEDWKIEKKEN